MTHMLVVYAEFCALTLASLFGGALLLRKVRTGAEETKQRAARRIAEEEANIAAAQESLRGLHACPDCKSVADEPVWYKTSQHPGGEVDGHNCEHLIHSQRYWKNLNDWPYDPDWGARLRADLISYGRKVRRKL